jgi:hypothetical protein
MNQTPSRVRALIADEAILSSNSFIAGDLWMLACLIWEPGGGEEQDFL